MRATRLTLGLIGVLTGAYGIRLVSDLEREDIVAAGTWLVGGVLVHDGVFAPVVLALAALAGFVLRGRLPAPIIVGAIVLVSVTVVALPVLGRFGAKADNLTLLDRNYAVGWFVFAGLTVGLTAVATLWDGARKRRGDEPA